VEVVTKSTLAVTFLVNVLTSAAVGEVWGTVNVVQLIAAQN
jgi:hypothetical protein